LRALVWCAVLASTTAIAWPADAADRIRFCGDDPRSVIEDIVATNATCVTARDVARAWLRHPNKRHFLPDSRGRRWRCLDAARAASPADPGFTGGPPPFTCSRRASEVSFYDADVPPFVGVPGRGEARDG
jgi:hypothetical protein